MEYDFKGECESCIRQNVWLNEINLCKDCHEEKYGQEDSTSDYGDSDFCSGHFTKDYIDYLNKVR